MELHEVVGRFQSLNEGAGYWEGACPFCAYSLPTLRVYDDSSAITCTACDFSGDVFSYLMRRGGIDFKQAMAQLLLIGGEW